MEKELRVTKIGVSVGNIRHSFLELTKMHMLMLEEEADVGKAIMGRLQLVLALCESAAIVTAFIPGRTHEENHKNVEALQDLLMGILNNYAKEALEKGVCRDNRDE